ncbi:hypothetical protein TSAR_010414 [Trichomalopsis sarcophagae]|uniref:Uncharacterized protein n=1 Tax=Trichomalopsis sarcophagae TaxID=543379 RepID=A0A232EUF5_9HYME|nr:hypothetical protein TSAR_010414 [Trichomalopsis sarcophagae]
MGGKAQQICAKPKENMIFKVPIKSEHLTLHMHTDFVLFKGNYCVKSVIDAIKFTNDEVCTVLVRLFTLNPMALAQKMQIALYIKIEFISARINLT